MAFAVNVTLLPEQTDDPGLTVILLPAGNAEFTVIVIEFEVAGELVAHVRLLVITHAITSLFASDELE